LTIRAGAEIVAALGIVIVVQLLAMLRMITSDWVAISFRPAGCIPQPAACIHERLPWLKSSRLFINPNGAARNRSRQLSIGAA
jgi:hypothetical protein